MVEGKRTDFIVLEAEPFNGGAPADQLIADEITPNDLFFVRNHAPIPCIAPAAYRLRVEGLVKTPLTLSLADLKPFPRRTLIAVLQCAGNRRVEMEQIAPILGELIWDREAVSNAEWSGYLLRDVLRMAGVDENASDLHVAFEGLDQVEKDDETFPFGGSIPLEKALTVDVLLADTMNGEPLPLAHGYPLRVLAAGYIGARSVKWLSRIIVQRQPSDNYYQAHAYKLFPSDTQPETANWESGLMLGELNVNGAICAPNDGDTLAPGVVTVRGYALGGGRGVARVDVSSDGCATWTAARLHGVDTIYGWRLWSADLTLTTGEYEIVARAWDKASNTQPEQIIWNFKGYMNNACPRIHVKIL
jgi:sulfite oxidase